MLYACMQFQVIPPTVTLQISLLSWCRFDISLWISYFLPHTHSHTHREHDAVRAKAKTNTWKLELSQDQVHVIYFFMLIDLILSAPD